jgi:hypothetical protein
MTPRETAEAIAIKYGGETFSDPDEGHLRLWYLIELALNQAWYEGYAKGVKDGAFQTRHAKDIAVAAERERCARIAEDINAYECLPICDQEGHGELCPFVDPSRAIAAAIREKNKGDNE